MSALEICFTGFAKQQRKDLEELATESGFVVRKAATKNLHILCAGGNAGPKKVATAKADGAVILLENQFLTLVRTGEITDQDAEKLSLLLSKRENAFREYQFNKYLAHYSESYLNDQIENKLKTVKCHNDSQFTEKVNDIAIKNNFFCFTGDFAAGESDLIQAVTAHKGAFVDDSLTLRTKYLVVGSFPHDEWAYGHYGLKIEKALALKEKGHEVYLIPEEQWLNALI